jgi:hypothetical protein
LEEWIDLMERLDFNLGDGVNNSLKCFMAWRKCSRQLSPSGVSIWHSECMCSVYLYFLWWCYRDQISSFGFSLWPTTAKLLSRIFGPGNLQHYPDYE